MASRNFPALPSGWRVEVVEDSFEDVTYDHPSPDSRPILQTNPEDVVRLGIVGPPVLVLRYLTLRVKRPGRPAVEVTLIASPRNSAYRIESVRSASGLTTADLSGLRLTALVNVAGEIGQVEEHPEYADLFFWPRKPRPIPPQATGRGARITEERLRVAAKAWRTAKADGVPVKQAVADALQISLPQAGVYIRRAREHRLIPPR